MTLPGWVLIDRLRSALYVVDLVRFLQMAAGYVKPFLLIFAA